MGDDFLNERGDNDVGTQYQRLEDDAQDRDSGLENLVAPVTRRQLKIVGTHFSSSRRSRSDVRERLASVREYLADPRPDPQWEKMVAVLNVLLDIFWIVASMAVFHLTDFYIRVMYDRRMDRDWLMYSAVAFALDLAIGTYYIVYLTCLRRVPSEMWDAHWRWGFPLATLLFFISAICFTVAAWQIWWIFTPLILFLFFMGFVTVVSYIPDFGGRAADLSADGSNKKSAHSEEKAV